ncbi:MAG: CoA-binding protein [Chloroflexi bacterium]|nr:CoA-binding protein [Chloroflexota bacterium]
MNETSASRLREQLDLMFKPRSIAFVGASNDRRKWGEWMVYRPLNTGFRGQLYPVNPREKTILGLPAFAAIGDIPDTIDLAVITVPAEYVPDVMEQCVRKGVRAAIVITAGMGEKGPEGLELQNRVRDIARDGGIRFIGPNCMGIWSAASHLSLAFAEAPRNGSIAFLSQSGTFGGYLYSIARDKGYGLSAFVSMGNQADLNAADLMEYFADDPDTKVIALYLEGVQEGHRFFEVARRIVKRKPIVAYKAGRTSAGSRATQSHTGSLAGADAVFDAMCRQAGIIRPLEAVHTFDMAEALTKQPLPRGKRVGIVAGGGGQCVVTADFCAYLGLDVPELDAITQDRIAAELVPHAPIPRNPVDLGGGMKSIMSLANIVNIVAGLDYIDGVITSPPMAFGGTEMVKEALDAAEIITRISARTGKPVIASGRMADSGSAVVQVMRRARIPFYDTPEECARAMYALMAYGETRLALGDE